MPQEAGERTRQGEAEGGEEGGGREGDHAQGDRRDQGNPTREAIEPIDKVHGVLHAKDPEEGKGEANGVGNQEVARAERIRQDRDPDAERDWYRRDHQLAGKLPACPQIEAIVGKADDASE